jgi:hypothetical protein
VAIVGKVRLRRHLLGRQVAIGTPIAAKRAYPFSGTPTPNLNWTEADVDAGALYPVVPRFKGLPDLNFTLNDPSLAYNDLPLMFAAFFGNAETPTGGGSAKTWTWTPDGLGSEDFDAFTYEFGDDADGAGGRPSDWEQYSDGILTSLTIDSPDQGGGVLTAALGFKFADLKYAGSTDIPPAAPIPSITDRPDTQPVRVYLKDCSVYLDTEASDIGSTQLMGTVHKFNLTATQEVDEKRYADGTQSFAVEAYGRGATRINLAVTGAKTADWVGTGSESDAWSADDPVARYYRFVFESTVDAGVATPYSWEFSMPARYFTREHGEIGNNSVIILTAEAFLDDTLDFPFSTEVVNTLASAGL